MTKRKRAQALPARTATRTHRIPRKVRSFDELDDVTLAAPVHVAALDRDLPAGSHGTVVGVWQGGRAYEVEFSEPFEALVTVPAEGLHS